ncbi:TNF receptor-associated factor 4-like [Dysidea avara]|uniref:TNF receptor-associated factor 4-like n=1 Tax=Dysidea avara TaxID=196820 RepID=UPI003333D6CC
MASLEHSATGGYENEFIEEPEDRLVCSICLFPCRDAHMSVCCGHNFCRSCVVAVATHCGDSTKCVCPVCRGWNFTAFKNKQADREIRSFRVYCTNIDCTWEGELNDLSTHVSTCRDQFEDVQCPNNCGEVLQRRYITSHIEKDCSRRLIQCQYCDTSEEKNYIEGTHTLYCPNLWRPCPNKCNTRNIPYDGIMAHKQECPLEKVNCEYHSVGCCKRMVRRKRKRHEKVKMEAHLRMTKIKLSETEVKLSETETKLSETEVRLSETQIRLNALETIVAKLTTDHGPQVRVVMPTYTRLKQTNADWYSAMFETHPRGYRMKLNVVCGGHDNGTGTHLSVYLCNIIGPHDSELSWPLRGEFTITLQNQFRNSVEDYSRTVEYNNFTPDSVSRRMKRRKRSRSIRVSLARCSGRAWGLAQFISNGDLSKETQTCRYFLGDKLTFIIWFTISRKK